MLKGNFLYGLVGYECNVLQANNQHKYDVGVIDKYNLNGMESICLILLSFLLWQLCYVNYAQSCFNIEYYSHY